MLRNVIHELRLLEISYVNPWRSGESIDLITANTSAARLSILFTSCVLKHHWPSGLLWEVDPAQW